MRKHLPTAREAAKTTGELVGVALVATALALVYLPLALLFLGLVLVVGVNLAAIVKWHAGRSA